MSSISPIADARARLIAAALSVADAISNATLSKPFDAQLLDELRAAESALAEATKSRPRQYPSAALIVAHFDVELSEDGAAVMLANAHTRARLEPDRARAIAAALTATAGHIDRPRVLRRRSDVNDALLEREV
ncbi:hypothetical protein [Microbacterium saperdae]|uniref:Uncharacterized protein n=1 Tax=Microbacterium saperdae TaxID=69368 RepID=A0A543BJ76_9MICO|nr:hypothetical protein [Microbacterium saperdae]TQL84889.1 hypothetical protein FB560_0482 [Microbacterium saperdae]GGM58599.1 hypothetical protein GCM10010489_32840 [Microbacterium saperdae]